MHSTEKIQTVSSSVLNILNYHQKKPNLFQNDSNTSNVKLNMLHSKLNNKNNEHQKKELREMTLIIVVRLLRELNLRMQMNDPIVKRKLIKLWMKMNGQI